MRLLLIFLITEKFKYRKLTKEIYYFYLLNPRSHFRQLKVIIRLALEPIKDGIVWTMNVKIGDRLLKKINHNSLHLRFVQG